MYLICSLRTNRSVRSKVETKGMLRKRVGKSYNVSVSSPSWETIAPIVYALSLLVVEKATFKEALIPGTAASACFSVRCFPTLLSFEALPVNRTQESQRRSQSTRHHSEDGSPLPGWKIRSKPGNSRAASSGQLPRTLTRCSGDPNQGRRSPWSTCTAAP